MASRPSGTSCSIFVGNVPYDAQEDQLRELFGRVGTVTSVRLVCDKDTRQPKGYAFCDFADSRCVDDAIRQLNNVEYNGRRLRIDWAERELHRAELAGKPLLGGPSSASSLPALPAPVPTVADVYAQAREREAAERAAIDAEDKELRVEVARLMETFTPAQILQILAEMQRLLTQAPEVARALISENLQLCLALSYGQYLVGMTEEAPKEATPRVQERVKRARLLFQESAPLAVASTNGVGVPSWMSDQQNGLGSVPPPAPQGPLFVSQGPGTGPAPMVYPTQPAPPRPAAPTGLPPLPPALPPSAALGQMAMPAAAAPPAVDAAMSARVEISGTPEEHQQLMQRLVQLTPAQIDQLPHETKVQLLQFLQQQSGNVQS